MTYLNQSGGEGRLEIENLDGAIVFRVWPPDNGEPMEFLAESQMDLHMVQIAVDCSNYVNPSRKPKRK